MELTKLIILQALGGMLEGPIISVPIDTKEWKVIPSYKRRRQTYFQPDSFDFLNTTFTAKSVRFTSTGELERIDGVGIVEVFELEL